MLPTRMRMMGVICFVILKASYGQQDSAKISGPLFSIQQNGKHGYIDVAGRIIVSPRFNDAREFVQGLALVKLVEKWGYIDTTGNFIINPQFDEAQTFARGLALAKQNGKWGYIDAAGKFVINPQFDEARGFAESAAFDENKNFMAGFAPAAINGKWGYKEIILFPHNFHTRMISTMGLPAPALAKRKAISTGAATLYIA